MSKFGGSNSRTMCWTLMSFLLHARDSCHLMSNLYIYIFTYLMQYKTYEDTIYIWATIQFKVISTYEDSREYGCKVYLTLNERLRSSHMRRSTAPGSSLQFQNVHVQSFFDKQVSGKAGEQLHFLTWFQQQDISKNSHHPKIVTCILAMSIYCL